MRVQAPDGKVIEFPEGMAQPDIQAAMGKLYPAPDKPKPKEMSRVEVPQIGFPDLGDPLGSIGRAQEFLAKGPELLSRLAGKADIAAGTKTPEQVENRAKSQGRFMSEVGQATLTPWATASRAAGIGELSALTGRLGQSILLGGVQGTPEGPRGAAKGLGAGLLGGAAGEILAAPLKFIQMARAARQATADKAAFDKSMTDTLNQMASQGHEKEVAALKTQYEQAVRAHDDSVEKAATKIADDFKAQIPAWKDYPSGARGIQEMVTGRGQKDLSDLFDAAIKGKQIAIEAGDARALGIKAVRGPKTAPDALVEVPADQANRLKGALRKKDPIAYDRVNQAIQNVLPPEVRQQYAAGQALIGFVDKSGALKGDKFNPDALVQGMNKVKTVDELRRRGQGDVFRGPLQPARDVAPKPGKLTLPDAPKPMKVPETGTPEGVKSIKNPIAAHPFAAGLATEGLAHTLGAKVPGLGLAGFLGASSLPKELVTQAPLTREQLLALAKAAGLTGTGVRSGIDNILFNPTK